MRWSQMYIPTLRDDPVGVESASHRLLLRAGFMRPVMAGHFALLPLGQRVRAKVMGIIRDEMNRIGGQEMLCPVMHPADLWRRSGRWSSIGPEMFRLKDRKDADMALGMTHEEVFAALAGELSSYRDLPQIWYQVQTRLRDEPRPKAGLLRTREFTMTDSCSFDADQAGLDQSFELHRGAYERIFRRLGLDAIAVEASPGIMGGAGSAEFMSPCQAAEDDILTCGGCGYAASAEKAASPVPPPPGRPASPPPEPFATPQVRTIQDLAAPPYGVAASRQIKTLVYVLDGTLTLVLLRGDHALGEQKLIDVTASASVRPGDPGEIHDALGALPGSLGAVAVSGIPVIADTALCGERDMVTGANTDGVHLRHVDIDRDIAVSRWADVREVTDGDPCPRCGKPLAARRAAEIGHIFKLGQRYSRAFGLTVLDEAGQQQPVLMGSYGIGVERAMAAITEAHHDEQGMIWPASVAPFGADVIVAQPDDGEVTKAAEELYGQLADAGVDVIIDDRPARAGVKFRDAELTGIPCRVTVGRRGLARGTVDITRRRTGHSEQVSLPDAARYLAGMLQSM